MEYHTKWKIIDEKQRKTVLTNKLELHIIQLTKINEKENVNDELIDWLTFIKNPNSERTANKMSENNELKEAKEKLETMSEDEKMQRFAEWRQDAIYTENTIYASGVEDGKKIGEKSGEKKNRIEIAKKLLKIDMKDEQISEITGLDIENVKELKEKL